LVSKPLRKTLAEWIVQVLTGTEGGRADARKRNGQKLPKRRRKIRSRRPKL
jgi:hypothetical protein